MLQRLEKRSLLPRATRHRWACMPPAQGSLIPGITTAVSSATAQQHYTRAFQRCYCSSHCSHKTLPSPFKNFLKRIYLGGGGGNGGEVTRNKWKPSLVFLNWKLYHPIRLAAGRRGKKQLFESRVRSVLVLHAAQPARAPRPAGKVPLSHSLPRPTPQQQSSHRWMLSFLRPFARKECLMRESSRLLKK